MKADLYFIACQVASENFINLAAKTRGQIEIVDKKYIYIFGEVVSVFYWQDLILTR